MTSTLWKRQIKKFQEEILGWYEKNKRDLPWRHPSLKLRNGKGRDPYAILVSEVMSQQTQINRVVPKYLEWMKQFPTMQSLAKAPTSEVLKYWNGLGYNRRAVYLKKCAEVLVSGLGDKGYGKETSLRGEKRRSNLHKRLPRSFQSLAMTNKKIIWPTTEEGLRRLPGIGEYTARAILCFAFGKQISIIDTNVRKVILVYFKDVISSSLSLRAEGLNESEGSHSKNNKKVFIERDSSTSLRFARNDNRLIQQIAEQLLPKGKAYEWNQALMDYASRVLKDKKIPIPKQSHFKTSNRFYRGQVVRLLLKKKKETLDSLFEKLENNGITKEKLGEILKGMERDGLVVVKRNVVTLP